MVTALTLECLYSRCSLVGQTKYIQIRSGGHERLYLLLLILPTALRIGWYII